MPHTNFQPFIKKTLDTAAQLARDYFGHVTGSVKKDDSNQVLTEADLKIGQFIVNEIEKEFPEHNIIDEEAGVVDKKSTFTWVIDPIDGTSNFAAGLSTYGIMLGLLKNDEPVAGGVTLPSFVETYLAQKGLGATLNGQPLQLSSQKELLKSLVAYQIDAHQEDSDRTKQECKVLANLVLNIQNLRSNCSVFDGACFLKGGLGAVLNQSSKIWDNVALQAIVEETGGIYTNFWGEKMDYHNATSLAEQNFTCCISTPALFDQVQKVIKGNKN